MSGLSARSSRVLVSPRGAEVTGLPKYLEIAEVIRQGLQSGDYTPGDALYLADLADEFEVTEPTALRALGILEQEELVRRGRGGWTIVKEREGL
jgi:DNA-binding GntR family transcriptional regulator